MKSNCCDAPIVDETHMDDTGMCSKCKEWAQVRPDEPCYYLDGDGETCNCSISKLHRKECTGCDEWKEE